MQERPSLARGPQCRSLCFFCAFYDGSTGPGASPARACFRSCHVATENSPDDICHVLAPIEPAGVLPMSERKEHRGLEQTWPKTGR